ncbi:DUF2491 family protein [Allochromatium tepidum]|nr:DUF2491 family protein [Allochromatium tepidum]
MPRLTPTLVLTLLLSLTLGLLSPLDAWAKQSRSSGGYSRPSSSLSQRTPATRSSGVSRTPSVSGGYSRPRSTSSSITTGPATRGSAGDQALSRQGSQRALDDFRRRREPEAPAIETIWSRPSTSTRPSAPRRPSTGDALLNAGAAGLGAVLGRQIDTPRLAMPPLSAVPDFRSVTTSTRSSGFPFGALLTALFLLLIGAVLVIVLWRRFFGDVDRRRSTAKPTGRAGTRAAYRPDWFRIGMTLPVDPSLFILAEPFTKLQAPRAATGSGLVSVERLGEVKGPGVTWYRLYVSGGDAFFQVHPDAHGRPDECRYFSRLDEVVPADADEWGVWLDRDEGLIGWPEFQTQDGRLYGRLWSPGRTRLEPYALRETLGTADGAEIEPIRQQAMLYARATGAQPPAPGTEYLLVAANEQGAGAWVSLHVGIDIPVAGLNLS